MAEEQRPVVIHIDGAADPTMPEFREDMPCPQHPQAKVETGFGLAGGGMGIYSYCGECGTILTKSQTE